MTRLTGEHTKHSASFCALLLGLISSTPALGEAAKPPPAPQRSESLARSPVTAAVTPEPTWEWVELNLELDPTALDCPQQADVATWANELVGRAFVVDSAPVHLTLNVGRAPNNELRVELWAAEQTNPAAAGESALLRTFQRALPCAELLRAAALTISLFAKSSDQAPQGTAATSTPSTSPLAGAPPPPPPMPLGEARPKATPQKRDRTLPAPAPSVPSAETPNDVPSPRPQRIVGVGGIGALGLNPGLGLGIHAQLGLGFPAWELMIRGGYLASTGQRLDSAEIGTIRGPTSELALAACVLSRDELTLRVCGFGGPLWVYARGEGFDLDRRALLTTLAAGGSAELLLAIGAEVALGIRVELWVPVAPVEYKLEGETSGSWTMWPVAPRLAVGVEWR